MKTRVLSIFSLRWRELAGFALCFRLLESALFAPAAALAGRWLLGRAVLDSTEVVAFLLSPRGMLALALAAVTGLSIRLVEHAGLSAIFFAALEGRRMSARAALGSVRVHGWTLVKAAARFAAAGAIALLPLVAVMGGCAAWLLPRHDVNYYLKTQPPEFIVAAVAIGVAALATGAALLFLVVRWRWAVQAVVFQGKAVREAFAESVVLTRGCRWTVAGALAAVALFSLALGVAGSLLGDACTSVLLGVGAPTGAGLVASFAVLLLVRTLLGAGCTFLGSCADAGIFTALYRKRLEEVGRAASLADARASGGSALPRWALAAALVCPVIFGATGIWLAVGAIFEDRPITIHAHRGVVTTAPENTLGAARAAIEARADYLETDVQMSRDGVLVLAHDSDFSRLAGVARKVWDLTYAEIREIPLGNTAEITPRLEELLALAKGRIKLNIELKYYGDHQPGLAGKVVEALRAQGMLDRVVIQCLEYEPLLEVRRLAPEVPVGYLLSFNARKPSRLEVDFLSVEKTRVDRVFLLQAHREGQLVYAWTVNRAEDMQRVFHLGVDGLITDQAALAREVLEDYRRLPKPERALRRVRAWLGD